MVTRCFARRSVLSLATLVAITLMLGPGASTAGAPSAGDVCTLPPDPGPCDGVFPRWFHNAETGECEIFIWGGCEGNANNFETLQACEAACGGSCPPDLDGSGDVGFGDLLRVLSAWGVCKACPEDLDGDGQVAFSDLLWLLGAWGPCTT